MISYLMVSILSEIYFDNISIQCGKVEMHCKTIGDSLNIDEKLFFHFSEDIFVDSNQIAIELSTLCGSVYDFVHMDLVVNYDVYNKIQNFLDCTLNVKHISYSDSVVNSGINLLLCFSGGFDSLAAYCILTDCCNNFYNVSLDFGGIFYREEKFFKRFSTYVVKTNFVDLKLNRNSMSFMYIPIIFYSNYLNAGYGLLADTLESGNNLFKRYDELILSFLGIKNFPLFLGLTEVGTALIVINKYPDLINFSLNSLANPGEEKRYRKQLFVEILSNKYYKSLFFEKVFDTNYVKWGNYIHADFLCLYIIKNGGLDAASKIMAGIPEDAIDLTNKLSLDFYEKVNIDFLGNIDYDYKFKILNSLFEFGIYPYNSIDYNELNEVLEFLSKYHPLDLK